LNSVVVVDYVAIWPQIFQFFADGLLPLSTGRFRSLGRLFRRAVGSSRLARQFLHIGQLTGG
jgi:hypothetical protein